MCPLHNKPAAVLNFHDKEVIAMASRHTWILGTICLALCLSLSIRTSWGQSSFSVASNKGQKPDEQKVPAVILNSFRSWSPDTIGMGGSSTISVSVTASKALPGITKVTLNFGSTASDGTANFAITSADSGTEDAFSFAIGPGETKTVTAKYHVKSFTRAPRIRAMCDMTVEAPGVGSGSPQTSASELWIR